MKKYAMCLLICAGWWNAQAYDYGSGSPGPWITRLELGGNIIDNPSLNLHEGFVTGGDEMELDPGFQLNVAVGYRFTPWIHVEGEFGFSYNEINAVGNWSYPDSSLSQFSMMANVVFELPAERVVPFAGIGAGGVLSTVSFGEYYYYYYSSSSGYGNDFVPAVQAFAGLQFRLNNSSSLGVSYHCLATDDMKWKVHWWTGNDFHIGVDSLITHQFMLSYTISF